MSEKRLDQLNPEWRAEYKDHHLTPDNSGLPTGRFLLTFRCPTCGPPNVVSIKIGAEMDAAEHCWKADPLPDAVDWPSRVTITPSINNTNVGHGRRVPICTFHGNITDGQIIP